MIEFRVKCLERMQWFGSFTGKTPAAPQWLGPTDWLEKGVFSRGDKLLSGADLNKHKMKNSTKLLNSNELNKPKGERKKTDQIL